MGSSEGDEWGRSEGEQWGVQRVNNGEFKGLKWGAEQEEERYIATRAGGRDIATRAGGRDIATRAGGRDITTRAGGRDIATRAGGRDTLLPRGFLKFLNLGGPQQRF